MVINNINSTNNTANISKNATRKNSIILEPKEKDTIFSKNFDCYQAGNKHYTSRATKMRNLEKISKINEMSEKEKHSEAVIAYGKLQRDILLRIEDLQNAPKYYESCLEERAYYENLLANDCVITEGKFDYKDIPEGHQRTEEDVRDSLDRVNKLIDYSNNPMNQVRQDVIYRDLYSIYSTAFSAATGIDLGELDAENICTGIVGNSTEETFKEETDKVIENLKKISRDWSGVMFEYEESRNQTESKEEIKSTFNILYNIFEKQKQIGIWDGYDSSLIEQWLSEKKDYINS